jgi:hypothetical protein
MLAGGGGMTTATIPAKACTCGHAEGDHETDRECGECGQWVDGSGHCTRVGCRCEDFIPGCQNCNGPRQFHADGFDICSRACLYQLQYARELLTNSRKGARP